MSRKDYVKIAAVLNANRMLGDPEHGQVQIVDYIITGIAKILAEDNPRFDRARFYAACGLES